jgi:hypothetical protein
VLLLAAPFAELGHALAYGPRAPTSGPHWYFAAVLQASGAALGGVALAALAVLVASRLLSRPAGRGRPWSLALLFCGLLCAQLAVFLVQEAVEAHALPTEGTLAAGLLGQQPVALVAALLLRWLSTRLGPALEVLSAAAPQPSPPRAVRLALAPAVHPAPAPLPAPRRAHLQRGPPSLLF